MTTIGAEQQRNLAFRCENAYIFCDAILHYHNCKNDHLTKTGSGQT